MPSPRLEIRNICQTLAGSPVLDRVSLSVPPGAVTCLLGPSGCGKTTTLRIIAGIDRQQSGEVLIDGKTVSSDRMHLEPEHRSVGFLFQDYALFPHLTVRDNVAFGLVGQPDDRTARLEELLDRIKLRDYGERYPHELSGGQQQRVALARAIAPRPRILLMDEPFSNLDDRLRDRVREETFAILRQENMAALLITHEPAEAMVMADEIVLMRHGSIIQSGSPFEIYAQPVDREAAAFFSDINIIHGVVRNATLETSFGKFPAGQYFDGTDIEIIIRPQDVKIDFDRRDQTLLPTEGDGVPVPARVQRSCYLGSNSIVEFQTEDSMTRIKTRVPHVFLPKPGTRLWLSLPRNRCMLFPCTTQNRIAGPVQKTAISA
ncbi:MAG: ABC transporter ATP-binding protein [Rhodobacteraceae bacterium]|nr:ABC transporter ATP-binding protein [Paracoccaceae bacterium]